MPLLEHQCFSDFVLLLRERPSRHPLPAWRTPTHPSAPGSKATSSPWLFLGSRVPCSPSASSRRTGHSRRCVSPLQHLSLMLEVLFIVVFPTKLGYGRVRILAPKLLFPKYFWNKFACREELSIFQTLRPEKEYQRLYSQELVCFS